MQIKNACIFCEKSYPNYNGRYCPECNSSLSNVEGLPGEYAIDFCSYDEEITFSDEYYDDFNDDIHTHSSTGQNSDRVNRSIGKKNIRINGVIENFNTVEFSHRFFITKIFDMIRYGQTFSNTCQHFTIRDDMGEVYSVTSYGDIGGRGSYPSVGSRAEVEGVRLNGNVIMARHVRCNGGNVDFYDNGEYDYNDHYNRRYDRFQRHNYHRNYQAIIVVLALIVGILAFNFVPAFREFIIGWIVSAVLTWIVFSSFKIFGKITNIWAVLAVSFVLTICFMGRL